ncbi:hypothetical protein QJS10_CPB14g00460 [Acorus calamus]|uniref:Uncharacterized protein n=1 Tax=Acorus calamus TaxID=4465 RepID=A0AAV9DF06_ACOCL|nr:hypothetical protein QJS10_CPB14g00460 [Acorus calamus]
MVLPLFLSSPPSTPITSPSFTSQKALPLFNLTTPSLRASSQLPHWLTRMNVGLGFSEFFF